MDENKQLKEDVDINIAEDTFYNNCLKVFSKIPDYDDISIIGKNTELEKGKIISNEISLQLNSNNNGKKEFINDNHFLNETTKKEKLLNKKNKKEETENFNINTLFDDLTKTKDNSDITIIIDNNYKKFKIKNFNKKDNKNTLKIFKTKDSSLIKNKVDFIIYKNIRKKQRKFREDCIRLKIKSNFHKAIKNKINENLKKAGSILLFECLPQGFIGDISYTSNHIIMDYTYRQLLLSKLFLKTDIDFEKYQKNKSVLEYLDKNSQIGESSGFNKFCKLKYKDIYKNYLNSNDYQETLISLRKKNQSDDYIQKFKELSKIYLNSFY